MDLNALFKAPAGTPSPLREVYEAVAKYIRVACSLHQKAARSQTDVDRFVAAACALAWERQKAFACLAAAEIGLTANAPDAFAAFRAALEGVEPINHACADVLVACGRNAKDHLEGDFRPCDAYPNHPRFRGDIRTFFAAWPEVNERQLLEGMRQATVLAAARLNGRGQVPVPGEGPPQDQAPVLSDEGKKPPDHQQNTPHRQRTPKRSTTKRDGRQRPEAGQGEVGGVDSELGEEDTSQAGPRADARGERRGKHRASATPLSKAGGKRPLDKSAPCNFRCINASNRNISPAPNTATRLTV
jgi:hypothetical protein